MDDLRYDMYHNSKMVSIDQLPPTSYSLTGHLLRSFLATYKQINCLDNCFIDPKQFGFEEVDGLLLPSSYYQLLPDDLPQACSCKKCATVRCDCRKQGLPCCIFCCCHSQTECRNPFVVLEVPVQLQGSKS